MAISKSGKGMAPTISDSGSEEEILFKGRLNKNVKTSTEVPKSPKTPDQSTEFHAQLPLPMAITSQGAIETRKKKQAKTSMAQPIPKNLSQTIEPMAQLPLTVAPTPTQQPTGIAETLLMGVRIYMTDHAEAVHITPPSGLSSQSSMAPQLPSPPISSGPMTAFGARSHDGVAMTLRTKTPKWFERGWIGTIETPSSGPWSGVYTSAQTLSGGHREDLTRPTPMPTALLSLETSITKDTASGAAGAPSSNNGARFPLDAKPTVRNKASGKYIPPSKRPDWRNTWEENAEVRCPAQTSRGSEALLLMDWRARSTAPAATGSITPTGDAHALAGRWPTSQRDSALASRPVATASSSESQLMLALHESDPEHASEVERKIMQFRRNAGLSLKDNFTPMEKVKEQTDGSERQKPDKTSTTPEDESTAIYLRGLPFATTYKELLKNIHCGKIWHTFIDPPDPAKLIMTAAAKVAFCTRAQAEKFKEDVRAGRYKVLGQTIYSCIWDRRCEPERGIPETRCIQIRGDAEMMSWKWFNDEFESKMDLKIIASFEIDSAEPTKKIFEIHLAGIYAQSRAVVRALEKDFSDFFEVKYVEDPCEN